MTYLWLARFPPYPPLFGGDMLYSRELMTSLARHGRVRALAYDRPDVAIPGDTPIEWETLAYSRPSPLRSILSPLPDVAFRFRQRRYLDRAVELARDAEAVIVDFIGMAWIVAPLKRALQEAGSPTPVIMLTHNHEGNLRREMAGTFPFPKNLALALDGSKAARLERSANAAADGLTAIVEEDRLAFAQDCDTPAIVLLPGHDRQVRPDRKISPSTPRCATIIGNRSTVHKAAVLDLVLDTLHRQGTVRQVRIEVAGSGISTASMQRFPNVRYHGYVADLPAYLDGVRIGLVPDVLGGGFKMRVLSLAMLRVPILGLRSAMAGTTFEAGVHYVGVDTLEEMADILPELIDDTELLDRYQNTAFAYASRRFDWSSRGAALARFARELAPVAPLARSA